jgi:hypothetical protein
MQKLSVLILALFLLPASLLPEDKPAKQKTIPLSKVFEEVNRALEVYQSSDAVTKGTSPLPPLASIELDFKTVVTKKGEIGVNAFIFTIGGSRTGESTIDQNFKYEPVTILGFDGGKPSTLQDQLLATINEAARDVAANPLGVDKTAPKYKLSQYTATLTYGIQYEVSGGAKIPIHVIVLTIDGKYNKNETQQIKLTFANKKPTPAG